MHTIASSGQPVQGPLDRSEFISRNAAAKLLNVAPTTVSKLADRNQIRTRKIKGHSRQWFHRLDVLALLEVEG